MKTPTDIPASPAPPIDPASVKLSDFVDTGDPQRVLEEIKLVVRMVFPDFDFKDISQALEDVARLFRGEFPGYRASNTRYHDLRHTMEVVLAAVRMLHGASLSGLAVSARTIKLCILGSLFHDVGLIQSEDDTSGTGAKYTIGHEKRSVNFVERYFNGNGICLEDCRDMAAIIAGTNLSQKFHELPFDSDEIALAGRILASADLLAQMADREYLEKLLLLFLEFQEAGLPYESMYDLLSRTHGFYAMATERQERVLGNVCEYMTPHFTARWDMQRNLYLESIQRNMEYLHEVLELGPEQYMSKLKRGGIVQRLAGASATIS